MIKNKPFSTHYAQFIDYTAHKLAAFDYYNPHLSKLSRHTTNSCHVASIACGGRYVFEKVLNKLGKGITLQINTFERAFENKALSGLDIFKKTIRSPKDLGIKNGIRVKSNKALELAEKYLGKGYKDMGNGRYLSKDGLKQVRMGTSDILGKHGGGPHMNFERLTPNPSKPGKNMITENYHIYLND